MADRDAPPKSARSSLSGMIGKSSGSIVCEGQTVKPHTIARFASARHKTVPFSQATLDRPDTLVFLESPSG